MPPLYAFGHKPHITFFDGRWIVMFTSRSRHDWNERAWDWCDAR
jgi:hypothetical protein